MVLGGFTDQALFVGPGHEGRRDSVAELVRNDLNSSILEDAHAGVGSSKIDADYWSFH